MNSPIAAGLRLGVNIDHVATLREARYRGRAWGEPDPVAAALVCERAGAHGITAHLREDRRHIQDRDVFELERRLSTRLNLEMALTPGILEIALQVHPGIVCLVPEHRREVTTEGGLDVAANLPDVTAATTRLNEAGIEVSLFITPDPEQIAAASRTGAQFIELHTGAYAERVMAGEGVDGELRRLEVGADRARGLGLRVNAGHGLTLGNLPRLLGVVPHLEELNIGHSLIAHALVVGLETSVRDFLRVMRAYPPPAPSL